MFNRLLNPLKRRIQLLVTRGIVKMVDSATLMQQLQVSTIGNVTLDSVEHWEPYGFTAQPNAGSEVLLLSVGGRLGHEVAVSVGDRRYRMKGLAAGEVAIYDDSGQYLCLYKDRIEVKSSKVVVLSDNVQLGGEGGAKVARMGDHVRVGSGSSAGDWPIIEGSDKVFSV